MTIVGIFARVYCSTALAYMLLLVFVAARENGRALVELQPAMVVAFVTLMLLTMWGLL